MRTNSLLEIARLLEDATPPKRNGKLWLLRRDKVLLEVNSEIQKFKLSSKIYRERQKNQI